MSCISLKEILVRIIAAIGLVGLALLLNEFSALTWRTGLPMVSVFVGMVLSCLLGRHFRPQGSAASK